MDQEPQVSRNLDSTGSAAAESPIAEDGRVVCKDLTCIECGYNLHSLSLESKCPECATSIQESLQYRSLSSCDEIWLRKITRGCGLLVIGWLCASYLGCEMMGLVVYSQSVFSWLPFFATYALCTSGAILFCRREPTIVPRNIGETARRIVIVAAIFWGAWALLCVSYNLMTEILGAPWEDRDIQDALFLTWAVGQLTWLFVLPASLHYACLIVERSSQPNLKLTLTVLLWSFFGVVLLILQHLLRIMGASFNGASVPSGIDLLFSIHGVVFVSWYFLALIFLIRFYLTLRRDLFRAGETEETQMNR